MGERVLDREVIHSRSATVAKMYYILCPFQSPLFSVSISSLVCYVFPPPLIPYLSLSYLLFFCQFLQCTSMCLCNIFRQGEPKGAPRLTPGALVDARSRRDLSSELPHFCGALLRAGEFCSHISTIYSNVCSVSTTLPVC